MAFEAHPRRGSYLKPFAFKPAVKLRVFGVNYIPASLTLEVCVGWASDEHEALQLVQATHRSERAKIVVRLCAHQKFSADIL